MGCSKRAGIATFAFIVAAVVLTAFLCTNPDVQTWFSNPSTKSSPSIKPSPSDEIPSVPSKAGGFGVLTHRDAHHLPENGEGSPFFTRHNVSGALQPLRAYWEHLTGQQRRGGERRRLAVTQQVPINGSMEGTGSYYVTMQLGTPPQNVTLLLDSGSSLFWSECNDCPDCTGLHNVTAFLAAQSSTLATPSCGSCQDFQYGLCGLLSFNSTHPTPEDSCFSVCSVNRRECFYGYSYGDGSQTKGYIKKDVLSIPSKDGAPLVANVTFGCNKADGDGTSANSLGLAEPPIWSPDISGILGLSKGNYSVLSQLVTGGLVERKFGHCLGGVEGGGLFTLGADTRNVTGMGFTKMGSHPEWYNATIKSLAVANATLPIPPSVFYAEPAFSYYSNAPDPLFVPDAIFDSGTAFTILPDAAYAQLAARLIALVKARYRPVYVDELGYITNALPPAPPPSTKNQALAPASTRFLAPPPYSSLYSSYSDWLCFAVPLREVDASGEFDRSPFPTITLTFDGATLAVRPEDYLVAYQVTSRTSSYIVACPTFISDKGDGLTIIGEYSMRNQYVVFDSLSSLIGIAPVNCSTLI